MGGGGRVTFYFGGKVKEEDWLSKLDDDWDLSEDEWGEGREYGEDAEKEKKIKMAPEIFTITCLDFVLDEVKPLGFLYLDVKGWEAYALRGSREALRGVKNTCFVVCEVWDYSNRKRRYLALSDADGSGPPCDDVLAAIAEHPNFDWNQRYR